MEGKYEESESEEFEKDEDLDSSAAYLKRRGKREKGWQMARGEADDSVATGRPESKASISVVSY